MSTKRRNRRKQPSNQPPGPAPIPFWVHQISRHTGLSLADTALCLSDLEAWGCLSKIARLDPTGALLPGYQLNIPHQEA